MHKPHSERPKLPGLPRRRPDSRQPAASPDSAAMPRTVPILPTQPIVKETQEFRPSMRLNWSKAIIDQAQRGDASAQLPVRPVAEVRPVRSQAAARARAGEVYHAPVPAVEHLPAPAISVNYPPPPAAPQLVAEPLMLEETIPAAVEPQSPWTKVRSGFGAFMRLFDRG